MLRGPACSNASGRRIGPLPGKVGNRATGHILSPLRAAQAAGMSSPEYVHLGRDPIHGSRRTLHWTSTGRIRWNLSCTFWNRAFLKNWGLYIAHKLRVYEPLPWALNFVFFLFFSKPARKKAMSTSFIQLQNRVTNSLSRVRSTDVVQCAAWRELHRILR